MKVLGLIVALILVAACGKGQISSERWSGMSEEEKTLVVRSLMGGETVASRKGGRPASYSRAPLVYVERIDQAYERGDRRNVEEIWRDLAD